MISIIRRHRGIPGVVLVVLFEMDQLLRDAEA
jgi:hypothetical protein